MINQMHPQRSTHLYDALVEAFETGVKPYLRQFALAVDGVLMSESAPKRGFLTSIGLGKKEFRAWAMYDWGNSAWATTVFAGFLPIYYTSVAASEFSEATRTAMWGYTQSVALLIIAVMSPILGAMADYMGAKKRLLAVFMGFGTTFCGLLYFVGEGDWLLVHGSPRDPVMLGSYAYPSGWNHAAYPYRSTPPRVQYFA